MVLPIEALQQLLLFCQLISLVNTLEQPGSILLDYIRIDLTTSKSGICYDS
jgi:hypothetical protein